MIQQLVQSAVRTFERCQVLVDIRFRGARETPPHASLGEPEQQLITLLLVHRASSLVEIAHHHRHSESAEKDLVVVQAQPPTDQVQARVDVLDRPLKSVLDLLRALVVQVLELRLAGQCGIYRAKQPVEIETVIRFCPFLELCFHRIPRLWPVGANLGQGEVAFGELSAAAVHTVKDVHHHVKGLLRTSDLLDVQVDLGYGQGDG